MTPPLPVSSHDPACRRTAGRLAHLAPTRRSLLGAGLTAAVGLVAGEVALPSPAEAATATKRFGAYVPDPYWDWSGWPNALNAFTARTGQPPTILHWFAEWGGQPAFPRASAQAARNRGALPMLTWEPWDWNAGAVQSTYRLARITAGAFDAYLRSFAGQVKSFGTPLYLRFAPEMNGDWNPWSEQVNGNLPGDYVRAWNHVRSVFTSVGATNVRWVWTPINSYSGSTPLPGLFPGDAAVDIVGVDGYNWGTTKPSHGWQTFSQVFETTVAQVDALSNRPLWLTEVGCTELGGNKAAWVADMFARVTADSRIAGLVWFDADKETDWRVNSSTASLAAFKKGVTSGAFM
jgi:beta-mannanase